ncbi:MAG: caspase family protein [Pseudomonadales bacterium]|nr:caspase family protein [Pseudomonadales bacterium]
MSVIQGAMLLLTLLLLTAAAPAADTAVTNAERVARLQIVDCLLPGQVRQLGRRTFLSPRRPTRTTVAECELRGGEYVAFDRADYRTALKVWMEAAQAGDAEAQTNVGEIFEKGLGAEPNFEAAMLWYRKAAEQGYTRAQFNIGTLYEMGLGVPADKVEALNWYRRAWGMPADTVVYASAAQREQEALRAQLATAIAEKETQIDALRKQVEALTRQRDAAAAGAAQAESARAQAGVLQSLIEQLQSQQAQSRQALADITPPPQPSSGTAPRTRQPLKTVVEQQNPAAQAIASRSYRNLDLGRYFALLIGNQHYANLDNLDTPLNDVARARQILEQRYGFTVVTIEDSDNVALMEAINDLYEVVGENDNLLLFYAGHGNRLTTRDKEIGYWLPSNANPPPRDTFWVSNEFVSGHLSRLKARRVLVVADSCYAGLLSGEPSFLLLGDQQPDYGNPEFLAFKLAKRSRLLLSSGGDRPVLDGGGEGHSIFARAFLDELETNDRLLAAPELYLHVRDRVRDKAGAMDFQQKPDFKTIKAAGHEVGDFFFVPRELL